MEGLGSGTADVAATLAGHQQPPPTHIAHVNLAGENDVEGDNDVVEIDDLEQDFDADSALGSEIGASSFASLGSSILNYRYENGRRYHAYRAGEYPFPNDEKEQERENLKHHVFQLVLNGKLMLAPISPNPQRILDIGTGTGFWAIDIADLYPGAEVYGIDLSPIQSNWVPPNCSFIIDNVEDDWLYTPAQAFDYIHLRALSGSIKDWPRLYAQAYQHMKPGGWIESQDHDVNVSCDDDTINKATDWLNWMKMINEAASKFGKIMDVGPHQKQWMIDAGFADVHEKIYKVPIGRWPKDKALKNQGVYLQTLNVEALEPLSLVYFTKVLNMTVEQAHAALVGPRRDIMNPSLHLYINYRFVYGRKPLPGER